MTNTPPGSDQPEGGAASGSGGFGPPAQPGGYGPPPAPGYGPPPAGYGSPPQGYGQPGYSGHPQSNGTGTAALVVGIIALILAFLFFPLGLVLGIVAIVLGIVGRRKAGRGEASNSGQATAGLVLGIIATILAAALIAIIGAVFIGAGDEIDDLQGCLDEAGNDQTEIDQCNEEFADELFD